MNREGVLGVLLLLLVAITGKAQDFSEDPAKFGLQVTKLIQSHRQTEAVYQVGNKFSSSWSNWSPAQKEQIIKISLEMRRKGYHRETFFNLFAALAFAVSNENLTGQKMTKLLDLTDEILKTRSRKEFADFAHGLNFFLAGRYLSFTKNIKTQALKGSYEFTILSGGIMALFAQQEETPAEQDTTSTATDPVSTDETTDPYTDPYGEEDAYDPYGDDDYDPYATDDYDPYATEDDYDPYATDDDYDPYANEDPYDAYGGDEYQYDMHGDAFDDGTFNTHASKRKKIIPLRPEIERPVERNYVEDMKLSYFFPPLDGPSIELKGIDVFMKTHYDTMTISGVNGNFLLSSLIFAGEGGRMKWPEIHDKMDGATLEFGEWHFEADKDYFWTPNAKLTYGKFSDKPIEGKYEFKSQTHRPNQGTDYPIFTSNNADLTLQLTEKSKYFGGLQIRGNKFLGKAISRKPGRLEINAGEGNQIIVTAKEFILNDSSMVTEEGQLLIIHGSDSIYHPSVQMWYDETKEELMAIRTKSHDVTPFRSTYFGMEFNADMIKWNVDKDSIIVNMLNGKRAIPMTVESTNYFNYDRLKRLNPSFPIHPLSMVVGFAKKYGDLRKIYDVELVKEYDVSLPIVRANIKILEKYGMVTYDAEKQLITILDKGYHYFESAQKKKDSDHIYMASYSEDAPNAIIRLDSGQMVLNGVSSFSLVEGYGLEFEPDSTQQVTLFKDRGFKMDGKVTEGDFIYNGRGYTFNYDLFLLDMPQIDSLQLKVTQTDTTRFGEVKEEKKPLANNISFTSGTLYIENPENKAGHKDDDVFPYFTSNSEGIVYFDGKEILNGAYDRSVYFVLPPFEVDSIDQASENTFVFEGKFVSGGIFPDFEETMSIQDDKSLGFVHEIPPEGYNLYGTEARTYEKIYMSNRGIRGGGQIDFLTTQIFSDDFIYYPDSVSADGSGGRILPGDYKGASFPEAVLGAYDMYWLPKKDSMYLRTVNEPFKFYNSTAELEGYANITTNGVYGGGTMLTRGSKSISNELNFKEFSYSARHANFEILTDDPDKPAMAGDDIALEFDLTANIATIRSEQQGVAALEFPYAQMKTSIVEAVWDLETQKIVMTKPPDVPIEASYFYSTRDDLDSLAFNGEKATYNINTFDLKVEGIPYITVADSRVIPDGNTTTIKANSRLERFDNAVVVIDTLNGFHRLINGSITVISRNMFKGSAEYVQVVEADTFYIKFNSFDLEEVALSEKETLRMTVSGGSVPESQNLKIAPGFFYKGDVKMFAYKEALELDGFVRMNVQNIPNGDLWIPYVRTDSSVHPHIPIQNAVFEDGSQGVAGIHNNSRGDLYSTFVEKKESVSNQDFFLAKGELQFDPETRNYKVESPGKSTGDYAGYTFMYNDANSNLLVEGPASFFKPTTLDMELKAAVTGSGNRQTNQFKLDCMITMNFPVTDAIVDDMGKDLVSAVEIMGPNTANDPTDELLYKLANLIGNKDALKYRENQLSGYRSMMSSSREMDKSLVISGIKMEWNAEFKSWYSSSKIGVSHAGRSDVNAQLDGFLEIRRDETNADVMNLFIQASPEVWYYISYHDKNLLMYSSNSDFNKLVESKSNLGKEKPGELVFVVGDTNETLSFVNTFRKNYFGIDTPYNLSSPGDANLNDENFDTIEEDDDDGFGF